MNRRGDMRRFLAPPPVVVPRSASRLARLRLGFPVVGPPPRHPLARLWRVDRDTRELERAEARRKAAHNDKRREGS